MSNIEKQISNIRRYILTICEAAICVALALVLSYFKIKIGVHGGSVDFVMIPLILFSVHRGGVKWGVLAGLVFGAIKYFFAGGFAITWQSMLLDYVVAYGAVGVAGAFRGKFGVRGYLFGAIAGSLARFLVHYISGVTIYAVYAGSTYLGIDTATPWIYSFFYNGFYMVFNTAAAVVITPVLGSALTRLQIKEA